MTENPVRSKERFLFFGSPASEAPGIQDIVARMKNGWLVTGLNTAQYEEDFGVDTKSKYTVAVNTSAEALHWVNTCP